MANIIFEFSGRRTEVSVNDVFAGQLELTALAKHRAERLEYAQAQFLAGRLTAQEAAYLVRTLRLELDADGAAALVQSWALAGEPPRPLRAVDLRPAKDQV